MAKSKINKKQTISIEGVMSFDEHGAISFEVEDIDERVDLMKLIKQDFDGECVKVVVSYGEEL